MTWSLHNQCFQVAEAEVFKGTVVILNIWGAGGYYFLKNGLLVSVLVQICA